MQGPLADRISSGSSHNIFSQGPLQDFGQSLHIPRTSKNAPWNSCKVVIEGTKTRTMREPAQSKCTWTSQKEPFSYARIYNENAAGQGRGNRLCKPPQPKCIRRSRLCDNVQWKCPRPRPWQPHGADFVPACAVEMHTDIAQGHFTREFTANVPRPRAYPDLTPAFTLTARNPQCGHTGMKPRPNRLYFNGGVES